MKCRSIILLCFAMLVLSAPNGQTDTVHPDSSFRQSHADYSRADVLIIDKFEDEVASDSSRFLYTQATEVSSLNPDYKIDSINALPVPCLVNLKYRVYSQYTESEPYPPGTKILKQIKLLKVLDGSVNRGGDEQIRVGE